MEAYDPLTNAWTDVAPMGTRRYILGLAVVQGKLYAVGGFAARAALATAEAFDPQQNRWEAVAPLAQARGSFGAVAI